MTSTRPGWTGSGPSSPGSTSASGGASPLTTTTDLDAAVDGADVVYCAVRVGGIAGRLLDETAALAEGVIGQETTGAGGITFALRTVPVVTEIAEVVARRAPDAMFINFTNPVGLVTEAVRRVLGDRVVGICDAPQALCRRVAAALGREPGDLWFDYFGINHLGWLRGVLDRRPRPAAGPPRRRRAGCGRSRRAGSSAPIGSARSG